MRPLRLEAVTVGRVLGVKAAIRTDSGSFVCRKKTARSLSCTGRRAMSTGQSLRVARVSRSRASNRASFTICSWAGVSRATGTEQLMASRAGVR